jgi:hypothetical protein
MHDILIAVLNVSRYVSCRKLMVSDCSMKFFGDIEQIGIPGLGHVVALQVEFERQILKPAFHFIGFRLWV